MGDSYDGGSGDFWGLDPLLSGWWGAGYGRYQTELFRAVALASNVIVSANPAYTVNDFSAWFPQFIGPPSAFTGTITDQSPLITSIQAVGTGTYGTPISQVGGSGAVGLQAVGVQSMQLVASPFSGIAPNSTILNFGGGYGLGQYSGGGYGENSLVLTNPCGLAGNPNATYNTATPPVLQYQDAPFSIYQNPPLPLMVLQAYVLLANQCIFQARYNAMWPFAMANFIAHFATNFINSQGQPGSSAAQIAAAGLQTGILTSESVGGVSAGYTNAVPESYMEAYGPSWATTSYGVALMTLANATAPRFMFAL